MNLLASSGWAARMAARRLVDDSTTTVLDAVWRWQPVWSMAALSAVLITAWVVVALIHRSRRVDLPKRWRIALGLLRAAVIVIPILMLARPHLEAELEQQQARTLAVLLDRSASMSLADGNEPVPTSRWQRAVETTTGMLNAMTDASDEAPATAPRLKSWLFDERLEPAEVSQLTPTFAAATPGQTAIGPALEQVRTELAGQPVAGVLLLSDGADNASPPGRHPLVAAREFARAGIPVHACLVGNERPRELAVSIVPEAPFAFADDPVALRVRIEQQGFDGQLAALTVYDGDNVVTTRDVELTAGGQPTVERIEVRPQDAGHKRYRAEVASLPGELTALDNTAMAAVQVIDEPIRVLYVERWPRWQYRFLRNAIRRDERFETRLVLLTEDPAAPQEERQTASFPASAEELQRFDVVVVGDLAPQDLASEQWQWLHDHVVDDGAGVIYIAGPVHMPTDFADAPIAPLLPFERAVSLTDTDGEPFRPALTALGMHHPLMRLGLADDVAATWRRLPPLQWCVDLAELKPAAVVLAERPGRTAEPPAPLILLQRAGRGSALFVGTDETWRWRYEVGNRFFYGFWSQAIQHLGMPHRVGQFQTVRIDLAHGTIMPGTPATVLVALESGDVSVGPDGNQAITLIAEPAQGIAAPIPFTLRPEPDTQFLYRGQLELPTEGTYRLFVEGRPDEGDAMIEVSTAAGFDPERSNPRVEPALLRQIADVTGGEYVTLENLPELLAGLDLSPLRYRRSERIPLWDNGWLLGILALLLTTEWVLRKWRYLP